MNGIKYAYAFAHTHKWARETTKVRVQYTVRDETLSYSCRNQPTAFRRGEEEHGGRTARNWNESDDGNDRTRGMETAGGDGAETMVSNASKPPHTAEHSSHSTTGEDVAGGSHAVA